MTWQQSLLTGEASDWEQAVEETSAARFPLGWDILRTLHDPDAISEDKLAILAWALSVDIWDPAWPVEKKRSVVRRSLTDHALKGTIAGVRRYLEIEDADLVMYMAPPQRMYASSALSKEEMDAWLATMPQLRIYLRSKPGDGRGLGFADDFYADNDFATFDQAFAIYGRFPVLYDRGVSIPLRSADLISSWEERKAVQIERVSSPGVGGLSFSDTDFADHLFADADVESPRLYTLRTDRSYSHELSELSLSTVTPTLDPIDVRYDRESEIGNAGPAFFVGDFANHFFATEDQAEWMLFDRIYLHDTTRAAPLVDAISFVDHTRISMSPFRSEYMVDSNSRTDDVPKFEGDFADHLFATEEDLSRIERQMDAVAISKGYRDKALVTFETTRPRTWGDGYPLDGSVPLWSRVKAAL